MVPGIWMFGWSGHLILIDGVLLMLTLIINTSITDSIDSSNNLNTNHSYWTTDYPPITFINLWLAKKTAEVFGVSWMIGIKIMLLVYYLTTWVSLIYFSTLFGRKSIWTSIT